MAAGLLTFKKAHSISQVHGSEDLRDKIRKGEK